MADLQGPLEARLLALERRHARIDELLSELKRQRVGLWEQIWDAASEAHGGNFGSGHASGTVEDVAPPTSCAIDTVTVKGCGNAVFPGVTVELRSGATTLASGVTNAFGIVAIPIPVAATYTYVLTPPAGLPGNRYDILSGPVSLTCTNSSRTIVLAPKAAYVCCGGIYPVKKTLFLTIPTGATLTMTNAGGGTWTHVGTTPSGVVAPVRGVGPANLCTTPQTVAIPVAYTLECTRLTQGYRVFDCCLVGGQGLNAIWSNNALDTASSEQVVGSLATVALGPVSFTMLGTMAAANYTGFCGTWPGAPIPGDHVVSE